MLHNSGPFGPNDVPLNVNAQANMTPMTGRMNIANNINNMGKLPHPSPQTPSSHFNFHGYSGEGSNINPGLGHFQNFLPLGFPSNTMSPNSVPDPWQSHMLPMNLNVPSEQPNLPAVHPYDKKYEPVFDYKEQSHLKNLLSAPTVHTKAFHKQMNMDLHMNNQHNNLNSYYRHYPNYNLDLSSRNQKPSTESRPYIDQSPSVDKKQPVETSSHYSDQNLNLSNTEIRPFMRHSLDVGKKNHLESNSHYLAQNLDLSNKSQKAQNTVLNYMEQQPAMPFENQDRNERTDINIESQIPEQKPASAYSDMNQESTIKSTAQESRYPEQLDLSLKSESNSNMNFPSLSLDNGFYKDQDSRRRSLENTVKMIENILSHTSNSKKSDSNQMKNRVNRVQDKSPSLPSTTGKMQGIEKTNENDKIYDQNKEDDKSTNVILNTNSFSSINEENSECDRNEDKMDVDSQSSDESDTSEIDNVNILDQSNDNLKNTSNNSPKHEDDSDCSDSETEDVKPNIHEINAENNMQMDESVVIKIEVVPSILDMEILNPYLKDSSGVQNNSISEKFDTIDADNSVNVAREVIRNGASVLGAYFECPHCGLYFKHPKRFLVHTKWHSFGLTNEKRMELQKEKELRRHLRKEARVVERMNQNEITDVNVPGRKFNCKDCSKVFSAKASLKNHRQRYHPTRVRECKICGKSVVGWMALRAHMATHTCDVGFQCSECPKRFKHAHSLAKHKDTHLEKTHGCQQCPKMFGSAALLNVHMKTHERLLKGATFRCTYCGKGFFESYSLQVHERTHRNERPYTCDICNTSFGTNSSLKRHLKVSHNSSKPFECATCHRSFISEAIRDRHSIRNHGNPEDFKFMCKQCPCKYLKLKDLRKHMYKVHPKGKRKKKDSDDESE